MTALTPQQRDRLQAAIDELAAVILQARHSNLVAIAEAIANVNRALQSLDRADFVLAGPAAAT